MPAPTSASDEIEHLLGLMAALRRPDTGCAWDLAQTHASLAPYVLEEAYEVADAIDRGSPKELCDELGDLLLQVVFHAQLAHESGAFSFSDVVRAIAEKLVRRHPHVFANGEGERATPEAIVSNWERIKAEERAIDGRGQDRVLDGVPLALPGLTRALKLQGKASRVGFDWGDARLVLDKIREEIDEVSQALDGSDQERNAAVTEEIGDLLFAVANLARHSGVDPETAVRCTNAKFERRFAFIEDRLSERGVKPADSSLAEMDGLWDEAKSAGL